MFLQKPARAVEIVAKVGSAASSRSHKAALSTLPVVINFYHTGEKKILEVFA